MRKTSIDVSYINQDIQLFTASEGRYPKDFAGTHSQLSRQDARSATWLQIGLRYEHIHSEDGASVNVLELSQTINSSSGYFYFSLAMHRGR